MFTSFQDKPFASSPNLDGQTLSKVYDIVPDLVVLELERPFSRTSTVIPACLPRKPIGSVSCFASGWGHTNPRDLLEKPSGKAIVLKAVKLKILSPEDCEDAYNSFSYLENYGKEEVHIGFGIKTNMSFSEKYRGLYRKDFEICVKGGIASSCQGDSGGPLICNGKFCK